MKPIPRNVMLVNLVIVLAVMLWTLATSSDHRKGSGNIPPTIDDRKPRRGQRRGNEWEGA